ncbi:hypothetical protein [Halioxenophilus sp. WMMB6]|uniref:hypothetical protein n=1 Tax=Halioxenophilus sp. WMMB6 TaxID=3073815 RepID=UPI00295EAE08|nr:hypothetical protein [Halioxenophilus sp. WMMB6]
MLSDQELIKEVSPTTRRVLGVVCLVLGLGSLALSYLGGNDISLVLSIVVGIPIIFVGISLLFGRASKGKGILSPFTLYLFGSCSALASVWGIYAGASKAGIGILIAFGCFALAKKRSKEARSW